MGETVADLLLHWERVSAVEKLLLAAPRGYCAGVDRAVQTVERALELHGAPVYVRKEIVHNKHVVEKLRERGAIFVDELDDTIPEGAVTVFSAHGVSPAVHAEAERRGLRDDRRDVPARHQGPPRGGQVRRARATRSSSSATPATRRSRARWARRPTTSSSSRPRRTSTALEVEDPEKVAYISQTTLSVDETRAIIARLRERFPSITGPRTDDICYATTNRQAAVKQMAEQCDLVLVIGSQNSSNSQRLVEVAREHGADSYLIDNAGQVHEEWLEGKRVVGISSGRQRARGARRARSSSCSASAASRTSRSSRSSSEDVRFMLPKKIRQALAQPPPESSSRVLAEPRRARRGRREPAQR